MPTTATKTQTVVIFTVTEFQDLVSQHMSKVKPSDAAIVHGDGPQMPTKFLGLVFGVTREQLDSLLRPKIKNLPPVGSYSVQHIQHKNDPNAGGLRVSWVQ